MLAPELKKILIEVKPFKRYIPVIAVFGVLAGLSNSSLSLLMKEIFDGLTSANVEQVQKSCLIAVGLSLLANVSRYYHLYLMNYVAECVGQRYRQKLLSHFLKLNLGFHNTFDTGSGGMLSRILSDAGMIQTGLRMIADTFLHPIQLISSIAVLFYLDWKLTLILFLLAPILGLFLRSITRSLKKYVPLGQKQIEIMTSTIKEALDGIRIIQSFNLEKKMDEKLKAQADEYLAVRRKVHSRIEVAGPVTEFLATLLILGIMIYTVFGIAKGESTPGTLIAYVAGVMMLSPSIKKVQENLVRLPELIVCTNRIYKILEDTRVVPEPADPKPFPKNWQSIEFKDVSFSYGDRKILDRISFTVQRGSRVAFVGESGSGKSTILNLLERFFDPSHGEILIDGISTRQFALKDLRDNIAMVSQDVFLFRDTIENNIWSGNYAGDKSKVPQAASSANTQNFMHKLPEAMQTNVGDRGALLSGGEKQRISIARAVFKDAPILLLDEATSALDSANEIEVQKGLDEAMKGRTSLIVAHRLSTIQNADHIFVLRAGKIVEQGAHEALLSSKGAYFGYWQMQKGQA